MTRRERRRNRRRVREDLAALVRLRLRGCGWYYAVPEKFWSNLYRRT
jgi:hypothetical protein